MTTTPVATEIVADDALLALLQVLGGSFPTGAFTHSSGLETLVQDGQVHDVGTFAEWLEVHIRQAAGPTDGTAVALVESAVVASDWDAVRRIDETLSALKLAPEIRAASLTTGRAMLRAAREVFPGPAIENFSALRAADRTPGNVATTFGCLAADLKLGPPSAVLGYLWSVASSLTSVATRLVPLGAIAAQRCLRELGSCLRAAAASAAVRRECELGSTALAQDVAAFRHERLYSRLCMS